MKLKTITKPELQIMLALHREQIEELEVIEERVDCNGCTHFWNGTCDKFKVVPPPEVQAVGCDDWLYDAEDWEEQDEVVMTVQNKPVFGRDLPKPAAKTSYGFDNFDDDIPF